LNKNTNEYYKTLFNNAYEPILLLDKNGFIDGNKAAIKILNMKSKKELLKLHPSQISPKTQPDGENSLEKSNKMIDVCLKKGSNKFEWLHKTIDDKEFLVEVSLKKEIIDKKDIIHVVWRDISEKKKYEQYLINQNEELAKKNQYINKINTIINSSSEDDLLSSLLLFEEYKRAIDESSIVSKSDLSGKITYVNKKFCEISGYSKEELIGKNHNIVRHPNMRNSFFKDLWTTIKSKNIFHGIIQNRKKNGETYYVDSTIIPILDKENNIVEFLGLRHDVTSIFEKDKLIYEQFTDELTLLPNRQKLLDDIKKLIFPKIAIINIDRFKDINDSYGIEVGDDVLKEVAKRLLRFKSLNLNVYRIGGDVFVLLAYGNISEVELFKTCKDFNKYMDEQPINIEDNIFDISATIGIASGRDKLISHAEIALMHAKQKNKNIVTFDEDMPIYKNLKKNIELTKDIKYALNNDGILVYAQKIIGNKTNKEKYETLMRMKARDGQIISPFFFLEHAKKAKLYSQMTRRMIEKSCEYFMHKDIEFSINLMIEDILNKHTINFLINKLIQTNTAKKVTLEIVESEGIEKFSEVEDFIRRLKNLGCKIAIDDFGTGYSNFEYVIKLNVDYLKIDGSLIKNIHINNNIKLTVETIINFTKVLNIETVAEFVHCEEVLNIVKELNIDYSQGFLLHEPEFLV